MGIPEHNLCVRNNKWSKKNRRRAINIYGMRPGKYLRKGKCKTWEKYRIRQIIDIEIAANQKAAMREWNVQTVKELWDAMGIRYGRYGKYDD